MANATTRAKRLNETKMILRQPLLLIAIILSFALLLLFVIYPLAKTLIYSLTDETGAFSLANLITILQTPRYGKVFGRTMALGLIVAVIATFIGYVFAYTVTRVNVPAKGFFKTMATLPILSPPFVLSLSIIFLFGKQGLISKNLLGITGSSVYGLKSLIVVQVMSFFPIAYLTLSGILASIDASVEDAACNMGAGSSMIGCSNYGDLTSTTGSRCGGITSAAGDATFENCANYGTILTDSPYRGVFWGYNNAVAQWTDCTAGGKVGTYNANAPVFDSYADAEQANYLGKQGANQSALTNIAYQIGNSGGGSAGGDAELRILFIGNSFTKDAVEHLPGILKAMGIDKVKMTHMYYGGRTVPEYNNGFATVNDYRCYECNPGAAGWTESMNKTIKEVAASEQWDVVTIQEHTGKVNAWKWTSAEKEALQGLIDNVKSTQTGAMPKFYYILSQAYADPALVSYSQQTVIVNNFASSQTDMYAAIVAQGQKVMSEVAFDDVIATGTVLQNLRTSKLQNAMDMTRDGYHMDYGISRYAASCAVFEKLISPAFGGVTLDGNPFRYTTSNTTHGSYSTPVTEANAPIALQAARYALTTPYAVTDMSHIGQERPDNGIEDTEFEEDQNKE